MRNSSDPRQNRILAAMSAGERERVYPHLKLVPMPVGTILYEPGDAQRHVYFPIDTIVSFLYVMKDGASAEIGLVGNEGLIGIALYMGGNSTPSRSVTQELIANMLGVRREGVTAAAVKLQQLGPIRYSRGRILVVNRPKLEELCCECYSVVKKETDRLAH
jgi:CRP-like cAMP-binding protein